MYSHTPTHSHTYTHSYTCTHSLSPTPPLALPLTHTPSLWKRRASPNDKVLFAFAHWISLCVVCGKNDVSTTKHAAQRHNEAHSATPPNGHETPSSCFIMMMTLFDSQSPQKEPSMKPNWTELSHPQYQQWKQIVKQTVGATYGIPCKELNSCEVRCGIRCGV